MSQFQVSEVARGGVYKFLDLDGVTIAHRKSNDCQAEASVELMTARDHSSRGIKPRNAPKQHIKAGIVAIDHE